MKYLHYVTFILLVVGGLNWLLTAFNWNVVEMLLGGWPTAEMIVYVLVGLSAIYQAVTHKASCKVCDIDMSKSMPMAKPMV